MVDVSIDVDLRVPGRRRGRPQGAGEGPRRRAVRARRGDEDGLSDRPRGTQGDASSSARATRPPARRRARRSCSPSVAATCSWSIPRTSSGAGGPPTPTGKGTSPAFGQRRHEWGDDILAIGTFIRNSEAEPVQLLRRRSVRPADPALLARGGRQRLPGSADLYLTAARDVAGSARCTSTATSGWPTTARSCGSSTATARAGPRPRPGDAILRDAPTYRSSAPAPSGAPARSTASIPATTGSWRCRRSTACSGAVPARRRRDGLERPPRLVHRARPRPGAGRDRVDRAPGA